MVSRERRDGDITRVLIGGFHVLYVKMKPVGMNGVWECCFAMDY